MTPDELHISAEDWPDVKALWFAIQEADVVQRATLLGDHALRPTVRAHVIQMMNAASRVGERFEQPAMVSLGMEAVVETPVLSEPPLVREPVVVQVPRIAGNQSGEAAAM